jgi:hypothetical protein
MSDDITQIEAKLHKLAKRLQRGWAKLYPVTEKTLVAVREVVSQEWDKEQEIEKRIAESRPAAAEAGGTQSRPKAEKPRARVAKGRSKKPPNHSQDMDQDRGR